MDFQGWICRFYKARDRRRTMLNKNSVDNKIEEKAIFFI